MKTTKPMWVCWIVNEREAVEVCYSIKRQLAEFVTCVKEEGKFTVGPIVRVDVPLPQAVRP